MNLLYHYQKASTLDHDPSTGPAPGAATRPTPDRPRHSTRFLDIRKGACRTIKLSLFCPSLSFQDARHSLFLTDHGFFIGSVNP
jgi:hypothetical protein